MAEEDRLRDAAEVDNHHNFGLLCWQDSLRTLGVAAEAGRAVEAVAGTEQMALNTADEERCCLSNCAEENGEAGYRLLQIRGKAVAAAGQAHDAC